MERGFYSAAAGVLTGQKAVNVLANNVANVNTAGYKNQSTVQSSFREYLAQRINASGNGTQNPVGTGAYITVNERQTTDFSQGSFEDTRRNLDMAIQGEGFFLIQSDTQGMVLTRNGQFEMDQNKNLILPGVGKVLDQNQQPIVLENSNFSIGSDGKISQNGIETGSLYIATVADKNELTQTGIGFFQSQNGYQEGAAGSFSVLQGSIERSNTDMTREMSQMISRQNNFQSCSQILKIFDRISEISANQVGKIG